MEEPQELKITVLPPEASREQPPAPPPVVVVNTESDKWEELKNEFGAMRSEQASRHEWTQANHGSLTQSLQTLAETQSQMSQSLTLLTDTLTEFLSSESISESTEQQAENTPIAEETITIEETPESKEKPESKAEEPPLKIVRRRRAQMI